MYNKYNYMYICKSNYTCMNNLTYFNYSYTCILNIITRICVRVLFQINCNHHKK